jgi:hypothetical protein
MLGTASSGRDSRAPMAGYDVRSDAEAEGNQILLEMEEAMR